MKTFPEINALNLKDVDAALTLAAVNRDSVKAELLPDLLDRIIALKDRRRRLLATAARGAK